MRTHSAYIVECAECGAKTETESKEGVCKGCGRAFFIDWGNTNPSAPAPR
jgi:hypothetical protein